MRCRRLVFLEDVDFDPPAAARCNRAVAPPDEDPPGPGLERIEIAQRAQVAPDLDQRLLNGIARGVVLTNDEAGGRVQAASD